MDSGAPSYGTNRSVASPSSSPSTKPSSSPTIKKPATSPTMSGSAKKEQPKILAVRASDVPDDAVVKNIKDEPMGKVVSRVGDKPKADALVVDTGKLGKQQYQVLDKNQKVFVDNPEYTEESKAKKLLSKLKFKSKKLRSVKKILRNTKFNEQREIVFEINFNSASLAKSALNAPISCGFEAETVWPEIAAGGNEDSGFLDGMNWRSVSYLISDQLGDVYVDKINTAYQDWLLDSEVFHDALAEVVGNLVSERKDDISYISDYVYQELGADEVEDYKNNKLEEVEDDPEALEAYEDYDDDAWAREYVEEEREDEFLEWLDQGIRDNGEDYDEAWELVRSNHSIEEWADDEYGDWHSLLHHFDIYLDSNAGGTSVEAVAAELEPWAENNSISSRVEAGEYHSGKGVDNDYWRVEDDSSIEADAAAAEIISPVYETPNQMLKEMNSLFDFLAKNNVETNESTGLHVTMSWNGEQVTTNKLKMAVLLNDKYLLKLFDRENNTYAQSQLDRVIQGINELVKNPSNLKTLAAIEEILSSRISSNKFSSINFKDHTNSVGNNLIEFRIAGNADYQMMTTDVVKTVVRYAAIMQAGHDPDAFRKDYILALYRLIGKEAGASDPEQIKSLNITYGNAGQSPVLAALQSAVAKDSIETVSTHVVNALRYIEKAKQLQSQQAQGELFNPVESVKEDYELDDENPAVYYQMAKSEILSALALSALDIGTKRAKPPRAAGVAAIRNILKQLGLSGNTVWQSIMATGGAQMLDVNKILNHARSLGLDKFEYEAAMLAGLNAILKTQLPVTLDQPNAVVKYKAGDFILIKDEDYEKIQKGIIPATPEMFLVVSPPFPTFGQFQDKYGFDRSDSVTLTGTSLKNITQKYGIRFIQESVFERFDKLSLEEQLLLLEKIDSTKLNEAWSKKQNISEANTKQGTKKTNERKKSLRNPKDNPCWKGYKPVGTKKKDGKTVPNCVPESVAEGAVPDNRKIRILNKIMAKPLLASDLGAQMEAFFAIPDPLMVNEFRKQRAMAGDNIDLRPVVKGFIGSVLHPDVQKQVNISESVLSEYNDLGQEKQNIIKTISGLDATDKEQAAILDRIYKILNSGQISTNIDVAFSKPLVDENLPEAEKVKIRKDMTKIIASLDQDYSSMDKFISRLEKAGSVVDVTELSKTLNTFDKVFGDNIAAAVFITLANYGVGKKQKGPGEYALACLSNQIKLAEGEGDLEIKGIGKVELKAALSSAGGRIGYGGGSQKAKRAVIEKYAQYLPTVLARLNAGSGGSISIRPFVDALNTDLPTNNPENVKIRKALMSELLTMDLEKFAAPVVEKFATSMNFDEIETEYLKQNYAWYKDRDDFDALLLMHVPNRKTAMIRSAEDLIAFRNSGHANATSISIVPTQAGAGREQWAQLTLNAAKAN